MLNLNLSQHACPHRDRCQDDSTAVDTAGQVEESYASHVRQPSREMLCQGGPAPEKSRGMLCQGGPCP